MLPNLLRIEPAVQTPTSATLNSQLFANPGTVVLAVGPQACLRHVYLAAEREGALERLRLCTISGTDYATGAHMEVIQEGIEECLKVPGVHAVLLYATCLDTLVGTDFDEILDLLDNPDDVPVQIFLRGPLVSRIQPARMMLRGLLNEIPIPAAGEQTIQVDGPVAVPPLASDFAGVCAFLQDTSCEVVLHTPGGCETAVLHDEPRAGRWDLSSTHFNDVEATMGTEVALSKQLAARPAGRYEWRGVVGTPVPHITGSQFADAPPVDIDPTLPALGFSTTGFGTYCSGIDEALLQIGEKFIEAPGAKLPNVLVLGWSDMEILTRDEIRAAAEKFLPRRLNLRFFAEDGLSGIEESSCSELIWQVSPTGESLAAWMKKSFGIPAVTGTPVGNSSLAALQDQVKTALPDEVFPVLDPPGATAPRPVNAEVVVVADPFFGMAFQQFLTQDCGVSAARVVAPGYEHLDYDYEFDAAGNPIDYPGDVGGLPDLLGSATHIACDPLVYRYLTGLGIDLPLLPIIQPYFSGRRYRQHHIDWVDDLATTAVQSYFTSTTTNR